MRVKLVQRSPHSKQPQSPTRVTIFFPFQFYLSDLYIQVNQFVPFGSFTLHVQLGLGWDVFQNGWDGSQQLRRFVPPPPHHHHYLIFNTSNFLYQNGKYDRHWITTYNFICTFCHYFPKMVMQESKSFIPTVAKSHVDFKLKKCKITHWV